jgi:glutamate-1-semialdehyde 2,1-aminomutase
MNVGHVAITEVFTPEACIALNALGDTLKARLNRLFMEHQAQMRVTGRGSMLTLHPVGGEPSKPDDIANSDLRIRQLLYLDLLEEGLYIAGRGFMALSLALDQSHCDRLAEAIGRFLDKHRELVCAT